MIKERVRHIGAWLDGHYGTATGWTIAVLTLWQLVIATFGIDLCDMGYYLTFFENIFTAPQAVEYNFMYYLSGVVGGVLTAVLPQGGKWLLLRLAGVLCNTAVMVMLARELRRVVPATAVIMGFVMVTASLVAFPYTFNNDLMSALLWMAALSLTHRGLQGGTRWHLLAAGVIVGINTFTRIPNVLAAGLAVMPWMAGWQDRQPGSERWKQCGTMLAGMAVGATAVIGLMLCLGHWEIFTQNMAHLLGVATGGSGQASHNVGSLVTEMLRFYKQCALVGDKMFALCALIWLAHRYLTGLFKTLALLAMGTLSFYFMWYQSHIMHPLWVMSVTGCAWVIIKGGERRMAAWLGLFMLIVFPLGSDGATNNGGIIAWMAAPVAAIAWQRRDGLIIALAFIAVGLIQTVMVGAYFDGGALWHKTATLHDPRAAMVRTTPQRAAIINATCRDLGTLVTPGDTLLCYGSIPMMNHLTRTTPAMGCSWPELLSAQALAARLKASGSHAPTILRQKFNDLGPYWSQPGNDYLRAYPMQDKFLTQDKMDTLISYMDAHGYRLEWENAWFALYRPQQND